MRGQSRSLATSKASSGQGAFTIVEFVIASGLIVLAVGASAVFLQAIGVSLANVTNQSSLNQSGGHAAELIIRRTRLANTATNDVNGEVLTLSFDDDPETDSNGDSVTWNDLDHFERFAFQATDGNASTLSDNTLTWNPNFGAASPTTLISGGVRKLTGLPIFAVTNQATVIINFGLLSTNATVHSQGIEIRTEGRLRNRIQ